MYRYYACRLTRHTVQLHRIQASRDYFFRETERPHCAHYWTRQWAETDIEEADGEKHRETGGRVEGDTEKATGRQTKRTPSSDRQRR